jgi:hypothetical protein
MEMAALVDLPILLLLLRAIGYERHAQFGGCYWEGRNGKLVGAGYSKTRGTGEDRGVDSR